MDRDDNPHAPCAGCAQPVAIKEADIVAEGSGYMCRRCVLTEQIARHREEAARREAERKMGL